MSANALPDEEPKGRLAWYHRTPLYVRILVALGLGVVAGELLGARGQTLKPISDIVLRLLTALATPLVLLAVMQAILKTEVSGKTAGRLLFLLFSNTLVAILIGLLVANVIQPGRHAHLTPESSPTQKPFDITDKIPKSIVGPLVDNDIPSVVLIALVFGLGLRGIRERQRREGKTGYRSVENGLEIAFNLIMTVLHWVIGLVPLAVFAVVARTVGTQGIAAFQSLVWFVGAVLVALALQVVFYLVRLRLQSWVRPLALLRGGSEALLTAFSTASSTATIPITFRNLKEKVGLREESISLGVMAGGPFNHDGTALYEAMTALFVSQLLGMHLSLLQQVVVVFMSIIASVGAAGIPEAGLVTMLAVFAAVRLPTGYIPLLLTVDWFLDRCRTTINVLGDMTVTGILDGKIAPIAIEEPVPVAPIPETV